MKARRVSRTLAGLLILSTTLPAALKACISSSRVTSKLKLPTKTLFEMVLLLDCESLLLCLARPPGLLEPRLEVYQDDRGL